MIVSAQNIIKYLLAVVFMLQFYVAKAQVSKPPTVGGFDTLEALIIKKQNLLQTQAKLEIFKQQAIKANDDVALARSLYNLMRIRDLRTEDTLYFRNSAFMDTLLDSPGPAKLKAVLHLMRAQRISMFDATRRKFNFAAYRNTNTNYNYALLTKARRDSLANRDLLAALSYKWINVPGERLEWLAANPNVFLFDAQFSDVVLSERINLLMAKGFKSNPTDNAYGTWLSLPPIQFKAKLDSLKPGTSMTGVLITYKEWIDLHRVDPEVGEFIGSLARKLISLNIKVDSNSHNAYVKYLTANIVSVYPALKAHAIYQLCLLWNQDGNKYINDVNRYNYRSGAGTQIFDPQYQFSQAKAYALFNQNRDLMRKYPLFYKVLDAMSTVILSKGIRVEMQDIHLPDKELPFKVFYKNADTLFYSVIKVDYGKVFSKDAYEAVGQILPLPSIRSGKFALPLPADNNRHAAWLKLAALPAGHYQLLFSRLPIKNDRFEVRSLAFEVTSISAINTDEKIFVLDRQTGLPLAGAQIKAYDQSMLASKDIQVTQGVDKAVNAEGYIRIPKDWANILTITYKGDTIRYNFSVNTETIPDDAYDKERFDTVDEFYEDKMEAQIFTDRAIYRPGQTVHYKIIFLTNNAKTGQPILFNRETTNSYFKKWLSKAENRKLFLKNNFDKKIDSVTVDINDFGSFAGSFVLPKTASTGDWEISSSVDSRYDNDGSFKVEEYKRPTMELTMEKQKKLLRPGDPFTVKLKVRSFAGADLNNTQINYTISRSRPPVNDKTEDEYYGYWRNDPSVELIKKTGFTNQQGELLIPVTDTIFDDLKNFEGNNWAYYYSISGRAIDATGESTDVAEDFAVSLRPVEIKIPIGKSIDLQALPLLKPSTTNEFEGAVGRELNIKVYKVTDPALTKVAAHAVDQWYYPNADWNKWFPALSETEAVKAESVLVLDTLINTTDFQKLKLPKDKLSIGFYKMVATCKDGGSISGKKVIDFNVFDSKTGQSPVHNLNFMPFNAGRKGDTVTWYTSGDSLNYTIYNIAYQSRKKTPVIQNVFQIVTEKAGVRKWEYRIPDDATGEVTIHKIAMINNDLVQSQELVHVDEYVSEPEIVIEKYRTILAPGATEKFSVSIKTKNEKVAAELLTTLYDAALDKLEKHRWEPLDYYSRIHQVSVNWNGKETSLQKVGDVIEVSHRITMPEFSSVVEDYGDQASLQGRVAGLNIGNAGGLNEVVVTGYGHMSREQTTGSSTIITSRDLTVSSLQEYKQMLIVIDGEIYDGDLKDVKVEAITNGMILKGAEGTDLYGSRAAGGILLLSTKGPIELPAPPQPVVKVRKNFNETAFFFPQVHAGTDGYYSFSFTMPETATEWNWKMLAHTRKAQFVYVEKKLQTQLNLMVQPNMPRVLYQGDKIVLQSKISNLDTVAIAGKATCKIEDAATGQDLTAILTGGNSVAFSVAKKSVGSVSFALQVPAQQLNPLKIIITAIGTGVADAEEHTVPVLSSKVFVRQSVALNFGEQATVTVPQVQLPVGADAYGVGLSITQKPQAALLYTLPWLANYSYNCAEQTFNKLRAILTAKKVMRNDAGAQQAFKAAKAFVQNNKPKDRLLPDDMAAEAMPWLGFSTKAADDQTQLFHLLDTSVTNDAVWKHLERLYQLQQTDGGLSWFDGGISDPYISAYVLAGFGQLKKAGIVVDMSRGGALALINKLLSYNVNILSSGKDNNRLYRLYALSYWATDAEVLDKFSQLANSELSARWCDINELALQQQALLAITTFRLTAKTDPLYKKAQD